jgi:hypothetical protein
MLDAKIQQLAHDLGAGLVHLATQADLKALVHSRGLNMRHIAEVQLLLREGCLARNKLVALSHVMVDGDVDVKTVMHPLTRRFSVCCRFSVSRIARKCTGN